MAIFESDLQTYMAAQVTAATWFPGHIKEGAALPAIVYFVVSRDPIHELNTFGYVLRAKVQFSVFSHLYSDTINIETSIRTALNGYTGTMGSTSIIAAICGSVTDIYEPPMNDSDEGVMHRVVEYEIIYQ